jgi:guanylate kinase
MLLVISAPSGAGKTTIVKEVLRQYPSFKFSISATTREMRPGETNGKDYFFLSKPEFEERVANDELVEYEEIYSNYYGTLKSEIEKALSRGENIVFDVDVKGGLSIKKKFPEAVTIFIRPPSFEVLKERLEKRGSETADQIESRLRRVTMELEKGALYDYIIINDDLKRAVSEVFGVINNKMKEFSNGTKAN